MLVEERDCKNVSLTNFYVRRCLRIWPVYFSFVAVVAILQLLKLHYQSAESWRGLLTFTRNFYDPGSGRADDFLTLHFWSLSIEEQFYMFWPIIFCVLGNRGRVIFLALAIFSSAAFRCIDLLHLFNRQSCQFLFDNFSTINYLDGLGLGCLGAIALAYNRAGIEAIVRRNGTLIFSAGLLMILAPRLVHFGWRFQTMGFFIILFHSVLSPEWAPYRLLNLKWMDRIGIFSYSIYIWQEIVWYLWPPFLGKVWFLWVPVALAIAWASYEFLEKPFFSLRSRFRSASPPKPVVTTSTVAVS